METLRLIGGGCIGFDLAANELRDVEARLGFAEPTPTSEIPRAHYRSASVDGGRIFERHDALRTPPVEQIGSSTTDLVSDIHLSIALHATDDVFVHAGVVALGNVAVLLPGRSLAGKSTLVHELVSAGASYLSDEYARITASGLIAPYARPIQLRAGSERHLVDPHNIGTVAPQPCVPGLVVFTHHREAAPFEPTLVPPAQAALELFDNTVVAQLSPSRALRAAAQVARTAIVVRSDRGEAAEAAAAILKMADQVSTPA